MDTYARRERAEWHRDVELLGRRIVAATAPAQSVRMIDPAEARFDAPGEDGDWRGIDLPTDWGGAQQWTHFAADLVVPDDWPASAPMQVRFDIERRFLVRPNDDNFAAGPEGQVFIDGQRIGAIDDGHATIRHAFKPGKTHALTAVFFAGRCDNRHRLRAIGLEQVDAAVAKLYHDLILSLRWLDALERTSVTHGALAEAVTQATRMLDLRSFSHELAGDRANRDPAAATLRASVAEAQAAFDQTLGQLDGSDDRPVLSCVGHGHIDLAWLWPMSLTRHKCVRTFATQCRLLDQYEGWVFNQSSPQAYAWVEADAAELFKRIVKQVDAGRWEADGATWVEMDTNVPSGESLVRQLLYGKRYFRDRFDLDSKMLWLPDAFGYSAALPQLLRLAGVDSFVTSKISWSQTNRFPHDNFRWRGIDGSEVLTVFIAGAASLSDDDPPDWAPGPYMTTYNAFPEPQVMHKTWQRSRHRRQRIEPLISFGHGDGGGGPSEDMLESLSRMAAWDLPADAVRAKPEKAGDLVRRIADQADDLPAWDGELYLEYHRGTYTTQAWLKRANRKCEIALHNVEWLATLARTLGLDDVLPDKAELDRAWQDLLLSQFHDILPGTSVGETYEQVRPIMRRIADTSSAMTEAMTHRIAGTIDAEQMARPVVLFNTLAWDRSDPIDLGEGRCLDGVKVPAGGWAVVDLDAPQVSDQATVLTVSDDGRRLVNQWWTLEIDANGWISRLHDRANDRDVLPAGKAANVWQVFEDRPLRHDAWDIDDFYEDHPLPGPQFESLHVVEAGDVRLAVELTWRMPALIDDEPTDNRSAIRQRIMMYASHPRIDFQTTIDWHEHHQLLKVAFPVDVRATEATCQIQFGHVRRPTHRNTSWDQAKFEVCAHQFVDLAEHGYGVALVNDCKYGHDVCEGVMRLTCIKSPQAPDAHADQGEHRFTYALVPHRGTFQEAGVIRTAAELNNPVIAVPLAKVNADAEGDADGRTGQPLPTEHTLVECDQPAVIVDTLKPAEDSKATIARLYESFGSHARATLRFARPISDVQVVDLLEQPIEGESPALVSQHDNAITVALRPFEVLTLALTWARR